MRYMVNLNFKKIVRQITKVSIASYIPTSNVWEIQFSTYSPTLGIVWVFHCSHNIDFTEVCHCGLNMHFPNNLRDCSLSPVFIRHLCVLLGETFGILYIFNWVSYYQVVNNIFWIQVPCQIHNLKPFSPNLWLVYSSCYV